ncbi:unnamed protein product [Spirodela intermedia]|uniref:Uncharacterized protein n=1 Tax=Spirodela intermedia TaxID=51605 RepID=A0A7I8KH21_SPIIN|nr:unnamed protein product [Spirodela intermedia]
MAAGRCDLLPASSSPRFLPRRGPSLRGRRPPTAMALPPPGAAPRRRSPTALETRVSLVAALAAQTISLSQRALRELLTEAAKYAAPSRRFGEPRSLEEALMSVPDLETVDFKVLKRTANYEIREVKPFFIAETTMPGKSGFDFSGSGQAFNVLAGYLFGKNAASEEMEMTTPVLTRRAQSDGERMEMTNPVITKQGEEGAWQMSFVLPSKYGGNLPQPKDPSVRIREVPGKIVAVSAFSGLVTDEVVREKELRLRDALRGEPEFQVKESTSVEVAQFNPPFTLPFARRNEVSLEVEKKG